MSAGPANHRTSKWSTGDIVRLNVCNFVQLIGTAGELPKAPTQQTKFLEDMDETELAQAVWLLLPLTHMSLCLRAHLCKQLRIPAGLQNLGELNSTGNSGISVLTTCGLGNTCYMNSTVQVLRQIPELKTALSQYSESMASMQPEKQVTAGLRDLYKGLDKAGSDYPPLLFWQVSKHVRPLQMDEKLMYVEYCADAQAVQTSV
jgi:ubiquitin carboxyl-terminal hydrolase 14